MSGVELVGATGLGAVLRASTTPRATRPWVGASFVDALDDEWRELVDSDDTAATVQQWGRRHPAALAGCRTLDNILELIRGNPDGVLLALLALAADGDSLAGRAIVQSMLPKLITMARRDPEHELPDYVSWLWLVLSSYPVSRRPRRVAANLALDTLKRATRQRRRAEIPYHSESLAQLTSQAEMRRCDDPDGVDLLTAGQVIRTGRQLGLLDDLTVRVLTVVYDHGLPGKEAATQLGMSVDSVRWRCSRAVRRLAVHSVDLLAAA